MYNIVVGPPPRVRPRIGSMTIVVVLVLLLGTVRSEFIDEL